jgi:type IV secretion system protein VirB9
VIARAGLLLALALPVALHAAEPDSGAASGAGPAMTTYRLSGDRALRPIRIGDDGVHTYIEWAEDQPMPAVFAIDARGQEEMVDGYVRGSLYTIDRVNARLVFRIDKTRAEARRNAPQRADP